MKKGFSAGLLAVALVAGVARADVYEWREADGTRHFTNSLQGVPTAYQSAAIVIVADWAHPAAPDSASAAPAAPAPPASAPAQAQVVTDDTAWNEAYVAGMRAAMGLGGGGAGGSVQINGPLAVASTRQSDAASPGFYPPWPWYYPLLTTGFDRGRSRHMTLRMLLQDQFALDREGPYAYERWDQPGLGPALAPFLSRGLPYGVSQYGRVIYR